MFETLTKGFRSAKQRFQGLAELDEATVAEALKDVRMSLLEADVGYDVVQDFCNRVKDKATGVIVKVKASTKEKVRRVSPEDHFVKICHDELCDLMGPVDTSLKFAKKGPTGIMLVGLQGSGKTTTVGKLARYLEKRGRRPLLVAADVYRPAAIEQLKAVSAQAGIDFFPSSGEQKPADIAAAALDYAKRHYYDVIFVDTAGRLAIDEAMMAEIQELHRLLQPIETLFVVDAMLGQDAVNTAKAFNEALPLTGIILTKLDGDSRGGAALSVRHVTGKPIKFAGVGEKLTGLEEFHPERMASRILGMGDILGLVEDAQRGVDQDKAQEFVKKMKSGKGFDLNDFKEQIGQMKKMGGMTAMLDKLPAQFSAMAQKAGGGMEDKTVRRLEGIINSMTPTERTKPDIIKAARKRRIATGAGVSVQEVNRLLTQFEQMQKMMKQMQKGGMQKMMRSMKGLMPGMR